MQRIYVHPLPVRIWHWVNASAFVAMLLTGVQLRYVGVVDLLSFETTARAHHWIGFVLIANFFLWLVFYLFSDKIRAYHPQLSPVKHFRASFRQLHYYCYGIFRGDPNPHRVSAYDKFNAMQRMMYQVVMLLLVPLMFLTGLLMWDTERFAGAVQFFGALRVINTVHVLIFAFFAFFIFLHVYLGSLGRTVGAHYKAMFLTGCEEIEAETTEAQVR